MSISALLKKNGTEVGIKYLRFIMLYVFRSYKDLKFTRKIKKMKHRLKGNGVNYDNKTLFNDVNSRLIFIHIPKSAGMSVVNTLYNQNKSHHASASDYLNEDQDKFYNAFSFAITRNPYSRLYSAYNYLKNGGMNVIDRAWWELYLAKYENFEAFIIEGGLEFAIKNKAEHFIPQYKFVFDKKDNLQCNYLGKIECITEVESLLTERLQREIIFSHNNVMGKVRPEIESIYTNEMLAIVNKCYQKDFSLLAYDIK